ncbi:hypothetical protein MesoLjLc_50750 [Mesorhizobium sp. L-8-10]|nr:hypothetical protein MesoLjLc_50750 [Mesorhizobium sp. L-8-10]
MASEVAVYHIAGHKRSTLIASAMSDGIKRCGDTVKVIESRFFRAPEAEIAVFYGYDDQLQKVFRSYREHDRTVVFVDLGYFGRTDGGKFAGFHKVSVNSRHPTAYFQAKRHDDRRAARFGFDFKPWRDGKHILVCGTSDKGARADGFKPQEWETWAIRSLRGVTDRPILYRPKPSWHGASPIPGSIFARSKEDVSTVLADCHAIVSHHSNVCVDGFLAGVPNFCVEGAGLPLSETDLQKIEQPRKPDGRREWANSLAHCQFNVQEMRDGVAWRTLKSEGLI